MKILIAFCLPILFIGISFVVFARLFHVATLSESSEFSGLACSGEARLLKKNGPVSMFFKRVVSFFIEGRDDFWKIMLIALFSRILVSLAASLLTSHPMFDQSIWMKWDARHYLKLAELGYSGYTDSSGNLGTNVPLFLVFFPLYPWLVRLFSTFTLGNYYAAALLVSNISFLFGAWYLYRLVLNLKNRTLAYWAVIMLCFSPATAFFGMPYTESLFLLNTSATLYYTSRRNWVATGIFGFLSSVTRLTGILVVIPALFLWLTQDKPFRMFVEKRYSDLRISIMKFVPWMGLALLGPCVYLLLNFVVAGDPFKFLVYQHEHWSNTSVPFAISLLKQWNEFYPRLTGFNAYLSADEVSNLLRAFGIHGSNIISFVFALFAMSAGVLPGNRKLDPYILFISVYMIISFSASWLLSGTRYVFACPAMYPALVSLLENKYIATIVIPAYSLFTFMMFILFLFGTVL